MEIKAACMEVLAAAYPLIPIFTEKVKQAQVLPCFFVKAAVPELVKDFGDYYWVRPSLEVWYYAAPEKQNQAFEEMGGALDLHLKSLGTLRGIKLRQVIGEGFLQVQWEYPYRCKLGVAKAVAKMGGLQKIGMGMKFDV